MKTRTDFGTYNEVLRTMPPEAYHTPADIDRRKYGWKKRTPKPRTEEAE